MMVFYDPKLKKAEPGGDQFGNIIKLHPDGQPWLKCCGCKENKLGVPGVRGLDFCAFRRNGTNYIEDREILSGVYALMIPEDFVNNGAARISQKDKTSQDQYKTRRFICVHRMSDDGFHRICAGWHAVFGRFYSEKINAD